MLKIYLIIRECEFGYKILLQSSDINHFFNVKLIDMIILRTPSNFNFSNIFSLFLQGMMKGVMC